MWLILVLFVILGFWLYNKFFKVLKKGNMILVTGAVKSGKSTLSFHLAYSQYKKNLRAVKLRNFFKCLFSKVFNRDVFIDELPLFYTTIPVSVPHVLITRSLMERDERFAYKSVIWVDEASLFADSQTYKDNDLNDKLLMFNKLIAHETKGGTIVYNTQSIGDLHYSIKRCLSEIVYVYNTSSWLPFLLICNVREERFSEDGVNVNTYDSDVAEHTKRVIVPKSVWKKFDCYCYSSLTDDKPINDRVVESNTLKAERIVSINPRHEIDINDKGV